MGPESLGDIKLLSVGAHHACAVGRLVLPPEPTLDWKRLLLIIGSVGIVVVCVLGLCYWCWRNLRKRRTDETARLNEEIAKMVNEHQQKLNAMTAARKDPNVTEVVMLASSPEFGVNGEPILAYAIAMVEVAGGMSIAGDRRDKFHSLVMESREMDAAMQGWRTAWKGKCESSFMFHKNFHPEAKQLVLSIKGGPECDWEQASLRGDLKKTYASQGITLETLAPFQDLSELKTFLIARNLEDKNRQIIEKLWVDYVNFCRITPGLTKTQRHAQSKHRTSAIVKA